jgi:hypothetical protein
MRKKDIMTDPLLKKGHPHRLEKYEPTVDEELEDWLAEEERLRQQQDEEWSRYFDDLNDAIDNNLLEE